MKTLYGAAGSTRHPHNITLLQQDMEKIPITARVLSHRFFFFALKSVGPVKQNLPPVITGVSRSTRTPEEREITNSL